MIPTLLLSACQDTPLIETGAEPPLTATITGTHDTYNGDARLLDERNEVRMLFGPAGGWTLSVDLEITGAVDDTFEITNGAAFPAVGAPLFSLDPSTVLASDPDGTGTDTIEDLRLYAAWDDAYDTLCGLAGASLLLSIPVEERATGRTALATRAVTAALDPANEETCGAR